MEQAKIDLLVIEAQLGDDKAFEHLFKLFKQSVLHYAYKVSADTQIAQDASQNSWIKVAKNLKSLKDPRAFKSWLFQLTHWQILDLLRKQKKEQNCINLDEALEDKTFVFEPPETDQHGELYFYINQLENIDKQAIHLFYLEQMSLQEISIVLAVPVGTIKSRLNRARNHLKAQLR
ncbi:MAG: RNA polymerase sigma factor [Thalassotalea sp.]